MVNSEGKGPAWSNSLFEDNAEFGLGMRLSADKQLAMAKDLLHHLMLVLGAGFVQELTDAPQLLESNVLSAAG